MHLRDVHCFMISCALLGSEVHRFPSEATSSSRASFALAADASVRAMVIY